MPLCLGLPGERPALPREAGEEAPLPATVLDRASLGLSFSVASHGAGGGGECWSLLGTSSQLCHRQVASPLRERVCQPGVLPLGEGPRTAAAAGGLLELLPYRHRRPRGDLEGLLVLLVLPQWGGDQAEVAQAVFL